MDLWIRSQDKTRLVRITQVKFVDKESDSDDFENVIRGYGIDGYNFRIGIYKSKEKAIEVLDEIQEAQLGNYHYRCHSNVKVSNNENTIVYEMPKE